MGRGRSHNVQAALKQRLCERSSSDRFEAVLGTTRGSGRVYPTSEQELEREAAARDALLKRIVVKNGDVYYKDLAKLLHRETGPAVERADGTLEWWQHGKRHREDGPAVELPDGTREWRQNDKLHRIDGPAIEYANGANEWWKNDHLHRENGPAVNHTNGKREWWINGKYQHHKK